LKFVDQFVTEISWEESDLAKSAKLHALMLTDSECERLKAFIDLLGVRLSIVFLQFTRTNLHSMQIENNKPSPQMQAPAYIWPFLLLKLYTRPGLPDYAKTNIHLLLLHFKQLLTKLLSIMRRLV